LLLFVHHKKILPPSQPIDFTACPDVEMPNIVPTHLNLTKPAWLPTYYPSRIE